MSAKFTAKVGAEDRLTIVLEGAEEAIPEEHIPCAVKTYTFSPQDVYVLLTKRIRCIPIRLYAIGKAARRRAMK